MYAVNFLFFIRFCPIFAEKGQFVPPFCFLRQKGFGTGGCAVRCNMTGSGVARPARKPLHLRFRKYLRRSFLIKNRRRRIFPSAACLIFSLSLFPFRRRKYPSDQSPFPPQSPALLQNPHPVCPKPLPSNTIFSERRKFKKRFTTALSYFSKSRSIFRHPI